MNEAEDFHPMVNDNEAGFDFIEYRGGTQVER
jgi:hypothetical protein